VTLRRSRTLGLISAGVLLTAAALTGLGAPALAETCSTTTSTVVPGISIQDPGCGFASLDGSSVYAGVLHGSAYRIEVPAHWNGDLVMFAHGFAGTGSVVSVSNPQLRRWYVDHGYAWAASSYRQNGYDVGDGVQDTHDLMAHFPGLAHQRAPRDTYMTGLSMGGEITAVEIERYRGQYTAAMPYCGVLGANRLFDYFLGANVTAAALSNAKLQYPLTPAGGTAYTPAFVQTVQQQEMPALGISAVPGTPSFSTKPTAAGQTWTSAVEQLSGGTRPGFPGALTGYWNSFGFAPLTTVPFLFGLYPGTTGGSIGYADGNVASNTGTTYQLDNDPAVSSAEQALNEQVLRVAATSTATTNPARTELPDIAGTPGIPVLSLHDLGDLFVPLSMDQVYARQVAANGQGALFADRAIRGTGHCEFGDNELSAAFTDLVTWAHTGTPAAGDDILDPAEVADPTFGCRFTDRAAQHVFFAAACPR
jgi:hypothetical protein